MSDNKQTKTGANEFAIYGALADEARRQMLAHMRHMYDVAVEGVIGMAEACAAAPVIHAALQRDLELVGAAVAAFRAQQARLVLPAWQALGAAMAAMTPEERAALIENAPLEWVDANATEHLM